MSTSSNSIELASKPNHLQSSFAGVAGFFAIDGDHSSTVFRRFDKLALQNLLYLQAKLAGLEEQQKRYDEEDVTGDMEAKQAATSWIDLERLAKNPGRYADRMKHLQEIQEALRNYQEALLLHSGVLALPDPPKTTLSAFKHFFHQEEGVTRLRKESSTILDDERDLASLRVSSGPDSLTAFVLNHMGWLFATRSGEVDLVKAKTLARFVNIVSTIIAAMLLIGAVTTLNFAEAPYHLIILAVYAAAFAAFVALMTGASKAEVFSASCAYMAVLVVFVGSTGNCCLPT
ncbi:MAG: hypothetical protein GOMPHAMPRED_006512 [Gomphillus americanus]|uniref:DUF6594 domain-containing protein n=1 Tax=Gomphillus americanus TaxID=1940652 RepID=A0A8H3G300_9LECA|nr:MAG: hypothetical protein GOMPHAMPRED_006512 [Gomphillus americanus]